MKNKKILFLVNTDWFFVSHRLPIALEAKLRGHEIHVGCVKSNSYKKIQSKGIKVHNLKLDRSSLNPFKIINSFISIFSLILKVRPNIVHSITIKPVILGGIATRFFKNTKFVASISGLGYIFSNRNHKSFLKIFIVKLLYKIALNHKNLKIIFQNEYDKETILKLCKISNVSSLLIKGSGVDLKKYKFKPIPEGKPIILFASRLLISKGIREFVSSAKYNPNLNFVVAGKLDEGNPEVISKEELISWEAQGIIKYIGFQKDIINLISKSSIVVLPSFYGEGLPKILIEAAALGRPIITTDHPGCRDAILNNKSGILVPIKDVKALSESIKELICNPEKMKFMGLEARKFADENFDIKKVIKMHMKVYDI